MTTTNGKTNTRSNARVDYHLAKQRISSVITTAKIAVERLGLRDRAEPHGAEYRLRCKGKLHLHGDRDPSMRVFDDEGGGGVAVYCPVCSWRGSVVDLAGIASGDRPHEIDFGKALDVAALAAGVSLDGCAAGRGRPRKLLSDEARADLYEVYNRLLPVGAVPEWRARPAWHDEVRAWAESRGIDVERLDKMRYAGADGRPLAGCLGADVCERIGSRTLSVVSRKDGSWDQTGHRFLVPLWDHKGRLAGFAGRATNGHAEKSFTSTGASTEGVVFANALGRIALQGRDALTERWAVARAAKPELNLPEYPRVYIAEGEVDFLTVEQHPDAETAIVFGVRKKGWTVEIAGAIPTGSEVYILADSDGPGCDYRDEIAKTLLGRKIHAYHVGDPADRPDQNDLYLADRAGYSPSGVCKTYEVPAAVQAAALDAAAAKRPVAERLLALAVAAEPDLIKCAEDGSPYLGVKAGPVETCVPAMSGEAATWLRGVWDAVNPTIPLRDVDVKTVLSTLASRASRETRVEPIYRRTGRGGGAVYLDICDGTGEAIEIDEFGYRVVGRPRCRFARPASQAALWRPQRVPQAEKREVWREFFKLVRVPELRRPQVVGVLLSYLLPDGPYPIMTFSGPEGVGKSTSSGILADVIDPSVVSQIMKMDREGREPRSEDDFLMLAREVHLLYTGNLSTLTRSVSNLRCQISTGSIDTKRALFTNGGLFVSCVVRPQIINGIPDLATQPDMLRRSIVVVLDPIPVDPDAPPDDGGLKKRLLARAAELSPKILGILCDGLVAFLRDGPAKLAKYPKSLPEFYALAEAGIVACGYPAGSVVAAYEETHADQTMRLLEGNTTYNALLKLLEAGPFEGRMIDLLNKLRDPLYCHPLDLRHLPQGPEGLAAWWRGHQKSLEVAGVRSERMSTPRTASGVPYRFWLDGAEGRPARRSEIKPGSTEDLDQLVATSAPHIRLVK